MIPQNRTPLLPLPRSLARTPPGRTQPPAAQSAAAAKTAGNSTPPAGAILRLSHITYDGKSRHLGQPYTIDSDSLVKHATEWKDVGFADDPATWAAFSAAKGYAVAHGGRLLGLAEALSKGLGIAAASWTSDSVSLEFRVSGESLERRDWFGSVSTYLTSKGLQTTVDYDHSGPPQRVIVGGRVEYRLKFLNGSTAALPVTEIPGLPGIEHSLNSPEAYPLHDTNR